MTPTPLSSFYYVENFAKALRALQARDYDLLNADESQFIREFFELPLGAQALIVRMALRRGPWYRGMSFRYPEIADLAGQLQILKSGGWITDDPVLDFQALIEALPLTCLVEGLGLRARPALSKERMKWQALEIYPAPLPLSATHFRLADGLYQFLRAELCAHLCAMYFGNRDQNWSEHVVADLGIRRYERVRIDGASRPFATRDDVEAFRTLRGCETLLEAGKTLDALEGLPSTSPAGDWLLEWHQRISLKIARQLEREGELPSAVMLYGRLGSLEAQERRRILTRRLLGGGPHVRFNHRSVPHFDLALAGRGTSRIEYLVAQHLLASDPGSEVLYAENRLINSLFGLLLWRAIFAPVRGAFFHDFHAAPIDLHSREFRARRASDIDACLSELDSGAYRQTICDNFQSKAGLLNPFVAWGWLRKRALQLALEAIAAAHLKILFEWMLMDLRHHTAGFPDLIQFWPGEGRYRMIEVKLNADRLQGNQRRFLHYAVNEAIPVSVCYVSAATRSARPPGAATPSRRAGLSLDLFPET